MPRFLLHHAKERRGMGGSNVVIWMFVYFAINRRPSKYGFFAGPATVYIFVKRLLSPADCCIRSHPTRAASGDGAHTHDAHPTPSPRRTHSHPTTIAAAACHRL